MDVPMVTAPEESGGDDDVAGGVVLSSPAVDATEETLGGSPETVAGRDDDVAGGDAFDAMEETLGGSEAAGLSPKTLILPNGRLEAVSLDYPSSSDGDGDDGEEDASTYRRRDKAPRMRDEEGMSADDLEGGWSEEPRQMILYREEPACTCYAPREDYSPLWSHQPRWGSFNTRRCPVHCSSSLGSSGQRGYGNEEEDAASRWALPPIDRCIPTGVGAGLWNLGNTCFMNSILQCFTHTVPLVKALRSISHELPCDSKEFCVVCTLREHIELSLASSGKTIEPEKFSKNLKHISSDFEPGQQEDAHEFLQCFLDKLERSSLQATSSVKSPSTKADNLVEQIFGGRLVSKLLCGNCGHCSERFEPLIDMSLEIEDVNTLENALESFTKVEKIEDTEVKITCENCKVEASMEKQLMLDKTPSVAALHLKRFKTDGLFVQKIGKHVKFPLELDLKPYTVGPQDSSAETKYQLYGFVVHRGLMPTGGHYFCYIRSSPDTWHKLDDSTVREVEEEEVFSQAPYILFYAREGTPWFSSLVEPQQLCSELSDSNPSPKSVLDKREDDKHTEEVRESASTDFSCNTKHEGCSTSETMDDAGENTAGISLAAEQLGSHLSCNESNVDTPMADAVAPLREIDRSNEVENTKLFSSPPVRKDTNEAFNNLNSRNGGHTPTPSISLSPDSDSGRLAGPRGTFPRERMKTENRVIGKGSRSLPTLNPKKREALRYVSQSSMPSSRKMMLLAEINHPQSDGKRRARPSPRKKAFSPSSCTKLGRRKLASRSPHLKLVRKIRFSGQ